ncbi:MAG: hypothetical protein RR413_08925 [Christensenellaceae bacterium]
MEIDLSVQLLPGHPLQNAAGFIETLFTEQLPATMTFIAALFGILAQIYMSWRTNMRSIEIEKRKCKADSIQEFYIPLYILACQYDTYIKLMRSDKDFDLLNINPLPGRNYANVLESTYDIYDKISNLDYTKFYPIDKKLTFRIECFTNEIRITNALLHSNQQGRTIAAQNSNINTKGIETKDLISELRRLIIR